MIATDNLIFLADIENYRMFYSKDYSTCVIKNKTTGENLDISKEAFHGIGIALLQLFKGSTLINK